MANILDKFKNTSVGSSGRILDYLSKLASNGDFSKIYDIDAIINSWNNILLTPKGSMNHDPEFGSNIYKFIFEPADTKTQQAIKDEIYSSLVKYDNRANISDVTVAFYSNKKGFTVSITADFGGEISSSTLSLDENAFQNFI